MSSLDGIRQILLPSRISEAVSDPDMVVFPTLLASSEEAIQSSEFYGARTDSYENNLHLTFDTHLQDEWDLRKELIARVVTPESQTVLDLGAGTGRDAALIVEMLTGDSKVVLHDASQDMLRIAARKLPQESPRWTCVAAPAAPLVYADETFDAIYSFGGFNEFGDARIALTEIARVARVGARILLVDEGFAPWLRQSEIYRILSLTNAQFHASAPITEIPTCAINVSLTWLLNGSFWCLEFTKGAGEPSANYDLPIPGERGGTHRTRYFGQLEGVDPALRDAAYELAAEQGLSRYAIVSQALERYLESHRSPAHPAEEVGK